tara:strand:- start:3928 stop:4230 length:303 start_codon:yes stop_codon:yes gene_type:complete
MWFWLFCSSLSLNIFLFFYIRWLLKGVSTMNEDMVIVSDMIEDFTDHVKSIHELEMYYGDETLQNLIKHGNEVTDSLKALDLIINEESKLAEETSQEKQK